MLENIRTLGECRELKCQVIYLVKKRSIVVRFSMQDRFYKVAVVSVESIEVVGTRLVCSSAYSCPFVVTNILKVPGCG